MKVVRYFVVGGVCAAIDITIFSVLTYVLAVHYLVSGAAGFLIATAVNYLLGIRFVFRSGTRFSGTEKSRRYLPSA